MSTPPAGGTLTLADDLGLSRMGYGAMQLAGPRVFGPPSDRQEAVAVLREAIELGVTHIDTSDYYGPTTVNEIIKEALHPYPDDLHVVTKVGARRPPDGSWVPALDREDLISAVYENLEHLGLDAMAVVNLRTPAYETPNDDYSLAEPFSVLAELQQEGLIRHLGVSGVTSGQLTEAQSIAPVVTVQNHYNLANRRERRRRLARAARRRERRAQRDRLGVALEEQLHEPAELCRTLGHHRVRGAAEAREPGIGDGLGEQR